MLILAILLAAEPASASAAPPCRASRLRLTLDGKDGDYNGMSHSGTQVAIRNVGPACMLAALPAVEFRTSRGRAIRAQRRPLVGMRPGLVMAPIRLAHGRQATMDLRWVSGPVFTHNRKAHAASVVVRIGRGLLRAPIAADLYGEAGKPIDFDQTPLQAADGR